MAKQKPSVGERPSFGNYVHDGVAITFEAGGFRVTATIQQDSDHGPPWEEEDGHGPVSDWTSRPKKPGERVLHEDHGSKRYYDVAEALEIAKRDGWDAEPYGGSKKQKAARAVEADFKNLRAWCMDEWFYVGVVLSIATKGGTEILDYAASLWGIAANCGDNSYLDDVVEELLPEALAAGRKAASKIKEELNAIP